MNGLLILVSTIIIAPSHPLESALHQAGTYIAGKPNVQEIMSVFWRVCILFYNV